MIQPIFTALLLTLAGACSLYSSFDQLGKNGNAEQIQWVEGELQARHIGTDSESLIKALKLSNDPIVRVDAAQLLGYRKEDKARAALLDLVHRDPESVVKETAAWALANMGDKEGMAALKALVPNASDVKRQSALAAMLADLGDPSSYSYVVSAVTSKDAETRFLSTSNLSPFMKFEGKRENGVIDPLERLQGLLRDKEGKVRVEALSVLSRAVPRYISRSQLKPQVEQLAKTDPDPALRATAERILHIWENESQKKP